MKELISVIIPIYNVEKYLKRCIDSVINQTYRNLEIILVDDGSPDQCGEICDQYAKQDERIIVIHKKNGGLSDARNKGLEIAKGRYISFIDSDDFISKYFMENLHTTIKRLNCDVVQCEYKKTYNSDIIDEKNEKEDNVEIYNSKQILKKLYSEDYLITIVAWNKLYKRECFDNIKYPFGKLHEDEATTYKILYNAKKIAIIRKKLYYYYYDPNSIMNKKYNLKRLDIIIALKERADFFKNKNEIELYELSMKQYCLSLINSYIMCKRYINNSIEIQERLIKEFRKISSTVIKYKNVKLKSKIAIIFANIFPELYEKILIK